MYYPSNEIQKEMKENIGKDFLTPFFFFCEIGLCIDNEFN